MYLISVLLEDTKLNNKKVCHTKYGRPFTIYNTKCVIYFLTYCSYSVKIIKIIHLFDRVYALYIPCGFGETAELNFDYIMGENTRLPLLLEAFMPNSKKFRVYYTGG